jgi:hypothetical protein
VGPEDPGVVQAHGDAAGFREVVGQRYGGPDGATARASTHGHLTARS